MVDGGDCDGHDVASVVCLDLHRQDIAAGAAQVAAELFAGDDGERGRPIAHRCGVAERGAHGRDRRGGNEYIAQSLLTDDDEVGPQRGDAAMRVASAPRSNRDRSTSLGEIAEDADDRRVLRGMTLQPSLTGPFCGRRVDSALCEPRREPCQGVVRGESNGVAR